MFFLLCVKCAHGNKFKSNSNAVTQLQYLIIDKTLLNLESQAGYISQ